MQTKPEIIDCENQDGQCRLTLVLSPEIYYFEGHFPGTPILAGVVQLNWAIEYAKEHLALIDSDVSSVEVLKFQQVLTPNTQVVLTLTRKTDDKFTFDYTSDSGNHASGRVKLGEPS